MNQGPFPKDILILIFKHIPPGTIARWRLVSKRWCEIITNERWYGNTYDEFCSKIMFRCVPEIRAKFAEGLLTIHDLVKLPIWMSGQYNYLIRKEQISDLFNSSDDYHDDYWEDWRKELCTRRGYFALKRGYINDEICLNVPSHAFRLIRTNDTLWNEFLTNRKLIMMVVPIIYELN
jgi:hypothetical protein